MSEQHKPCPFCGNSELMVIRMKEWCYVSCTNTQCGADGPVDLGESGAWEKWDTRPCEDHLQTRVDSLSTWTTLLMQRPNPD